MTPSVVDYKVQVGKGKVGLTTILHTMHSMGPGT